ncbi:4-hydroxybenzoate polyprenyltransferase [Candidatus Synechococcus spongiarum]|uniref:4-hydroxybenzoate solanesyltransferase n=1 Tax=Candidatus Synechococcus spongiarum TaxID=431041 RepID=A0A170T7R0_9SYNE|nr:4-hydroxybenzoate polyprenyltransferase [Candidatus Synechococcus spongiarum]CZB16182.1 4-hydroxybenzoate polyprenyltransferase (EC 2.5.1.39) @ Cyanobacterial polyprenyltransferase (UbiA homolog) [Candidatus Synechococcus spongiarum]
MTSVMALLRWDKPSGRLILLIPAGWAMWLAAPQPPPLLVLQILVGGLGISGAGCIVNDLWDHSIDRQVQRTRQRPLASGALGGPVAVVLLLVLLTLSLAVALTLPHQTLCLALAVLALAPILLYPGAKRVFPYPQLVLACTWGFAVLIPWAAVRGTLTGSLVPWLAWLATVLWSFGFDTVYAMADQADDRRLGIHSSVRSLGSWVVPVVGCCYGLTIACLGVAAAMAGVRAWWWLFWLVAAWGMRREVVVLWRRRNPPARFYGLRFAAQVKLGSLLLLGLVAGRAGLA